MENIETRPKEGEINCQSSQCGRNSQGSRVRSLALCALFAALTAVGAFLTIPVPPVPFTLQIFFAILSGMLLGSRRGAASVGVYVLLGLCGLPVLAKGGGPSYIFQPTFGYLAGFIAGAWVAGKWLEMRGSGSFWTLLQAALLGMATDFALGAGYFYLLMNVYLGRGMSLWAVLWSTVVLFLPADVLLMALAAWVSARLRPVLKREGLL